MIDDLSAECHLHLLVPVKAWAGTIQLEIEHGILLRILDRKRGLLSWSIAIRWEALSAATSAGASRP